MEIIPIQDGKLIYYPHFFSEAESDLFFQKLEKNIEWKQESIKIFGKTIPQPRLTAWYGDPGKSYTYSGLTWTPNDWNDLLNPIKSKVDNAANTVFNSVLLNLYRNGKDSMGWHSDDEPELGRNPIIASLSFGQKRMFHLKHRFDKELPKVKIQLDHGSLLIMAGSTQHYWHHQIPKTAKKIEPRINLTFRVVL